MSTQHFNDMLDALDTQDAMDVLQDCLKKRGYCVSGVDPYGSDLRAHDERVVHDAMFTLASALVKFAPDLVKQIVDRHDAASGALGEFLKILCPKKVIP